MVPLQNQAMKSVAYFVNWAIYGRHHFVPDLPASHLTHILYAFANIRPESGDVYLSDKWADTDQHFPGDSWTDTETNLYGNFKQLFALKQRNPNLKVLLSIGGWTYSANFAPVASDPKKREIFVETAVELLKDLGLDGLDLDWEYPSTRAQARDYVSLLRELRAGLDAYAVKFKSARFLLTIAAPCAPEKCADLDIAQMDPYLDFWNLMAYDFAGPGWSELTGHQANIYGHQYSADAAVDIYINAGVPSQKLILGMPLYGRVFANTDGPLQRFTGHGDEGSWETGTFDYKSLPRPGAYEVVDTESVASYSYDPHRKIMVTYDNVQCARMKADYIKHKNLGGAMWWESSGDHPVTSELSLIRNVVERLDLEESHNWRLYPDSVYANIRTSAV